jgi:plasmid maintenance system antidote protein VapI
MLGSSGLTFSVAQTRLLDEIRRRIRNGEYTERGLARLAGISQPHLHNLLKGVRELTTASADSLLTALDLGITDLTTVAELGEALQAKTMANHTSRMAPVLTGKIGPGWALPDPQQHLAWREIPPQIGLCGRRPVIAFLAPDPALTHIFPGATGAVIDLDELARVHPVGGSWYLVRHRGSGLLRQVRVYQDRIEILGQLGLSENSDADIIPLGSVSVLHIIRGRLVWAGDASEIEP